MASGVATVLSGYIGLLGGPAPEEAQKWMYALSIVGASAALILLILGFAYVLAEWLIVRWVEPNYPRTAEWLGVGKGTLLAFLLAFPETAGLVVLVGFAQISLGGLFFGSDTDHHYFLVALTITAGVLFGCYAVWLGRSVQRLNWVWALLHGVRVAIESAFLTYAGLVLAKVPMNALTERAKNGELDDPVSWMIRAGIVVIGFGSISLIMRQAHNWPKAANRWSFGSFWNQLQVGWKYQRTQWKNRWAAIAGRFIRTRPIALQRRFS